MSALASVRSGVVLVAASDVEFRISAAAAFAIQGFQIVLVRHPGELAGRVRGAEIIIVQGPRMVRALARVAGDLRTAAVIVMDDEDGDGARA